MRHKATDWNLVGQRLHGLWQELTAAPRPEAQPWSLELERAHREWMAAENYFQAVTDPELVDHAVFLLQACERKYAYLLAERRRAGAGRSAAVNPGLEA